MKTLTPPGDYAASGPRWSVDCSDALAWLRARPRDSIDLLFTSPPYLEARTYGIGAGRKLDPWVRWMADIVIAAERCVKGLIAVNCEGQTRNYRYLPAPFLLMAELHRLGLNLRKPVVFHRVGIPGSGGPDWLRNDWEPVVCVSRPGKLPWSCPTACGKPNKTGIGGAMSHRVKSGERINGRSGTDDTRGWRDCVLRVKSAKKQRAGVEPKVRAALANGIPPGAKLHTKNNGSEMRTQLYVPPELANPGNVLKCSVGGGRMGHPLAHENEAPFPLKLAEFFVLSFCPPGGVVADPFAGSGTTCHAAVMHGRRFVGCDVRRSQVDLVARRMETVTPDLFAGAAE